MIRHFYPHSHQASASRRAWEPCGRTPGKDGLLSLDFGDFAPVMGSNVGEKGGT